MAKALTAKAIEGLRFPGNSRQEIPDGLTRGLYLIVQPSGAKSWAVRYRTDGRSAKDTIGRYPEIGLAEAREMARDRLRTVAKGGDPREERKAARVERERAKQNTFAATADDFVRLHCERNNRSWREQERFLRLYALPAWGEMSLTSIKRADVARLVDELSASKPSAARMTLATVRKLFNWAIERGRTEVNPASRISTPRVQRRDRVLNDDELRRVWQAADAAGYPFGPYVEMLALTGCRRNEIAGMHWQDIEGGVLTIPGERYKTGIPHAVPLSKLAQEVLASVPRIEGQTHVFAGRGDVALSGFGKRKTALVEAAGVDFDLHDLRRTLRTGLSRLRVPFEVAERVLGHVQQGVASHYDRHAYLDEKLDALEAWGRHVESIIRPAPANVVTLRGGAA